eukprot:gene23294-26366_t
MSMGEDCGYCFTHAGSFGMPPSVVSGLPFAAQSQIHPRSRSGRRRARAGRLRKSESALHLRPCLAPAHPVIVSEVDMKTKFFATALLFSAACAQAQVTVKDPWVRATVPAAKASGAFMQLQSAQDARLVEVRSSVAGIAEIHQMAMENNMMKMQRVDGIELPAGKTVELASGGYHIMLMQLKRQLKEGETVPLTLVVRKKDKKLETIELNVAAQAHVTLEQATGQASSYQKLTFRVGHGCDGSPTKAITVILPESVTGAKPMPKPGWKIDTVQGKLSVPVESHGRKITTAVREVTWRGGPLADEHFDEFTVQAKLPAEPGKLYFKIVQECVKGSMAWDELPGEAGVKVLAPAPKAPPTSTENIMTKFKRKPLAVMLAVMGAAASVICPARADHAVVTVNGVSLTVNKVADLANGCEI